MDRELYLLTGKSYLEACMLHPTHKCSGPVATNLIHYLGLVFLSSSKTPPERHSDVHKLEEAKVSEARAVAFNSCSHLLTAHANECSFQPRWFKTGLLTTESISIYKVIVVLSLDATKTLTTASSLEFTAFN